MYGKVMSLPDTLILPYFELLTDAPDLSEMGQALTAGSVNPMELKKRLAREIVAQFHSPQAAGEAEAHFQQVFQRREAPQEVPTYTATGEPLGDGHYRVSLYPALSESGLVSSRGELKRLLAQGAIEVEGVKVSRDPVELRSGSVVKVGKRGFVKIVVSGERSVG
mgnify:FL=1